VRPTGCPCKSACRTFWWAWAQPLWQTLPLVKYAQFPWRFLGLVVFGAAMCGAAVADRLGAWSARARALVLPVGVMFILAAYFPYYSQARFIAGDARHRSVGPVSTAKLDALNAAGILIPVGLSITSSDIRGAGERATSGDDFLPRGVQEKPTQPPVADVLAAGQPVPSRKGPRLNDYLADLQMPAAGPVELQQFWFPGWQATIDGQPVSTVPSGPHAVVSCAVPAGNHTVEFRYHGLPQRRAGFITSCCALALATASLVAGGWNTRPRKGGAA